jgi:hypothetical protein
MAAAIVNGKDGVGHGHALAFFATLENSYAGTGVGVAYNFCN